MTEAGVTTYLITASAGAGGSISPSGPISVQQGAGKTFTITPNSGYVIADVKVDGVSKGKITSYTFSAVNANHTIAASFTPLTYTLSVTKNGTGSGSVSVSPTGTTFPAGTQVTLTAVPDANSLFSGWSGGCSGTATTCQGTMNSNVSVTATFTIKTNTTYTITATAGAGGSISPSGQISVQQGAGKTFTITPNSGYVIADVKVDGVSKGAITSYTFSAVNANHTISASYTLISSGTYTLSISKNGTGNGTCLRQPCRNHLSCRHRGHLDCRTWLQLCIHRLVRCVFRYLVHLPSNHELQPQCDGNLLSSYQGTGGINRLGLVSDF